jgi:hypothetical protein
VSNEYPVLHRVVGDIRQIGMGGIGSSVLYCDYNLSSGSCLGSPMLRLMKRKNPDVIGSN